MFIFTTSLPAFSAEPVDVAGVATKNLIPAFIPVPVDLPAWIINSLVDISVPDALTPLSRDVVAVPETSSPSDISFVVTLVAPP